MTDVFLVDKHNYPSLFRAFELISHDCGRQAGHKNYAVPLEWQENISRIDYLLHNLRIQDNEYFETFCIGEENAKKIITDKLKLHEVDNLLQRFFEEFS